MKIIEERSSSENDEDVTNYQGDIYNEYLQFFSGHELLHASQK